jgi:hypothetical protein
MVQQRPNTEYRLREKLKRWRLLGPAGTVARKVLRRLLALRGLVAPRHVWQQLASLRSGTVGPRSGDSSGEAQSTTSACSGAAAMLKTPLNTTAIVPQSEASPGKPAGYGMVPIRFSSLAMGNHGTVMMVMRWSSWPSPSTLHMWFTMRASTMADGRRAPSNEHLSKRRGTLCVVMRTASVSSTVAGRPQRERAIEVPNLALLYSPSFSPPFPIHLALVAQFHLRLHWPLPGPGGSISCSPWRTLVVAHRLQGMKHACC